MQIKPVYAVLMSCFLVLSMLGCAPAQPQPPVDQSLLEQDCRKVSEILVRAERINQQVDAFIDSYNRGEIDRSSAVSQLASLQSTFLEVYADYRNTTWSTELYKGKANVLGEALFGMEQFFLWSMEGIKTDDAKMMEQASQSRMQYYEKSQEMYEFYMQNQ